MEVKIGVQNASRELVLDSTSRRTTSRRRSPRRSPTDDGVLVAHRRKGRKVLVPVAKLAYVEIGTATSGAVGFRS